MSLDYESYDSESPGFKSAEHTTKTHIKNRSKMKKEICVINFINWFNKTDKV